MAESKQRKMRLIIGCNCVPYILIAKAKEPQLEEEYTCDQCGKVWEFAEVNTAIPGGKE